MTPRRYQFDNPLPVPRESHPPVYRPEPLPTPTVYDQQPIVVQHIHQAAPDRTVQRLALGAGAGGGAVAAGVFLGPMLITAMTSLAVPLAFLALVLVAGAWGVGTVVKSVGGPDGKAAAANVAKARRKHG
ncbi:DUF6251 family protein [Streptomyces endophytica]|uniref:DUF6251 family protein n=1 Tax=Streptomyces endophytica TaxID=2991496 RepID=A0ABY6PB22_9ACTN|nr:DUF6251 family protein [Streptomyces endophytica]UZJ31004.1 DUF6251 family protein [Streptomyces endophytica]